MKRARKILPQLSLLFYFVLFGNPLSAHADFTHAVKGGETLFSISKKYHIPVGEIQDANEIGDEKLQPGQSLTIPGSKPDGNKNTKAKKPAPGESRGEDGAGPRSPLTHKVKKGETLASIAKKYKLDVDDLSAINELKRKKVKAGQVLRLRLADEVEPFGPGDAASPEEAAENQEAPVYVPGSGFLLSEKNRELLAQVAKSFMGLRYTRGGSSINGMDCSSYVQKVYKVFGIDLPRTAREQFQIGYAVARNTLRAGDLVFFRRSQSRQPTHVGIYIGDNRFIHTSQKKRQVEVDSLESRYFIQRFMGAKRIEETEAAPGGKNPAGE